MPRLQSVKDRSDEEVAADLIVALRAHKQLREQLKTATAPVYLNFEGGEYKLTAPACVTALFNAGGDEDEYVFVPAGVTYVPRDFGDKTRLPLYGGYLYLHTHS